MIVKGMCNEEREKLMDNLGVGRPVDLTVYDRERNHYHIVTARIIGTSYDPDVCNIARLPHLLRVEAEIGLVYDPVRTDEPAHVAPEQPSWWQRTKAKFRGA